MRPRNFLSDVALLVMLLSAHAPAAPHEAQSADAFVDSLGVNTHYTNAAYPDSPYAKTALDQKLAALGIRHIRDNTETPQGFTRVDSLHARFGVSAILVPNGTEKSITQLITWLKQHPAYEAVEGLNEPDGRARSFNGATDVPKGANANYPATKAFQDALYDAVKADPRTKKLLVLSPAMAHVERQHFLDGIKFDIGSMHSYPFGKQPTAALEKRLDEMKQMKTPQGEVKPIWITETGYYNRKPNGGQASEEAAAKYMPRLFALCFKSGVARTYCYELINQGDDPNNRELNFGLLRSDLSEKPAYVAIRNLTTLLKDPLAAKKAFKASTLDFEVTAADATAKLEHLLLQKSDGRFFLLIWNEVPSWDTKAQADLKPPPIAANVTFATPVASAKVFAIGESIAKPRESHDKPTSIELQVPDEILAIELVLAR